MANHGVDVGGRFVERQHLHICRMKGVEPGVAMCHDPQAVHQQQENRVPKVTIFRPDGPQTYDDAEVDSFDNGVINFSIEVKTDKRTRQSFRTNLPFLIEHQE